MISSPLFREGDTFTITIPILDDCRMLDKPEVNVVALNEMQLHGGKTDRVQYLTKIGDYWGGGKAYVYYLQNDTNIWSDGMSVEGQRMFRFLKPLSIDQWNEIRAERWYSRYGF